MRACGTGSQAIVSAALQMRTTITAMQHLAETGGRYTVVGMCLGSGMGMAMLIDNLQR